MGSLKYEVIAIPAYNSNRPHGLPDFLGLMYDLTETRGLTLVHHLSWIGNLFFTFLSIQING